MRMDARFAQTVSARLCHDLGGVAGTLVGTLDLAGEGDEEMLALARDTAASLLQRLRLYAAAWGGATTEADAASLTRLLESSPASPRVRFDLADLAPGGMLPTGLVPLALNAALLAAEALPRGGTVRLSGSAGQGLVVCPRGRDAAWPAGLLALLAGTAPAEALRDGPRRVVAPLLLGLATEAGWAVTLAQGADGAAPPLLIGPA